MSCTQSSEVPIVNWPSNRIKAEQQHLGYSLTDSGYYFGNITYFGEAHFGQHRDGGAILEISLLIWALPDYSPQKKETGDGVRSILGAV